MDMVQLARGALAERIEGPQRLQGVAEQVEADGLLGAGREDVDHAAAMANSPRSETVDARL
jgi:hypothetical protein